MPAPNYKNLGIKNCVPSYNKLLIQYDLNKTNYNQIVNLIHTIPKDQLSKTDNYHLIKIPICYEEEFGLDLRKIASNNNLKIEEKWEETKTDYKENGFKVIVVKGFTYD